MSNVYIYIQNGCKIISLKYCNAKSKIFSSFYRLNVLLHVPQIFQVNPCSALVESVNIGKGPVCQSSGIPP